MEHSGGLQVVHLQQITSPEPPEYTTRKFSKRYWIVGALTFILIGMVVGLTTGLLTRKTAPVNTLVSPVPSRASSIDIHPNAKWAQNGVTVAGGNGQGNETNQLAFPSGLYVDDDQTIYVADYYNHRIVEWKRGAMNGQVVAGGNGRGNGANQLNEPYDVIVDKGIDSLIISDTWNQRVVRWPRQNGASGKTIISNITCIGLTMDENGSLYVSDYEKHEVRRYRIGDTEGTVVAGGNGEGNRLDQLNRPWYVFVDRDHSVYVSDWGNNRVMKWEEDAKQGIVAVGGQGQGDSLTQLDGSQGVVVDQLGTVYVTDVNNNRIMRWPKGATQGSVIAGGNGQGGQSNQLNYPYGLSFDRHSNLYIADWGNHQIYNFILAKQFRTIVNDFRQLLIHDETVHCLDKFSYLTILILLIEQFLILPRISVLGLAELFICRHIEMMSTLDEQSLNKQLLPKYLSLILQILSTTKNK
ncbi:unnamed protein product [Rotaria sordida]|uniref:NHL repeat containing protein n=1 Tax=Rotaria sordida TaxID=392033 RepID=A0A814K078_9BILA|nr:unnamed protein product [Rotaria sordida]